MVFKLMAATVYVPATERAQRERLRDLAVFERVGSDPRSTAPSLAVKKVKPSMVSICV
jgi:hypothetical protein